MRTSRCVAGVAVALGVLAAAGPAQAAISITRAELQGTAVRIEGSGAVANRIVTGTPGALSTTADGKGAFRLEGSFFSAPPDCTVTVSDGVTSAPARLSGCVVSAPPPPSVGAPSPLSPADAAGVTVPFNISWSAVSDPGGVVAYNWQVSRTTAFTGTSIVIQNSTGGTRTNAPVSGLANGTYFWRVQAVNGNNVQGAWSAVRSFNVTGQGATAPGSPVLNAAKGGTTFFHPFEHISFDWSPASGAGAYVVEASRDPSFPIEGKIVTDNVDTLSSGFTFDSSLQGTWFVRVYAVNTQFGKVGDTNGGVAVIAGRPSNTISFSVQFTNPVGPPPALLGPATGSTQSLPVTVSWTDGYNPQDLGYELEVSKDSRFSDCEPLLLSCQFFRQSTTSRALTSLSPGTWFWRVRSIQGDSSPTTSAVTAWTPARSFTVPATALGVLSIDYASTTQASGQEISGNVQLNTTAPAGGATVTMTSSDPSALPVQPTVSVPGGFAVSDQFTIRAGDVSVPTPVTLTASLGSSSATFTVTVQPASLANFSLFENSIVGGAQATGFIDLNWLAPPDGAVISITSTSPLVQPPATVTVPGRNRSTGFAIPTSPVTANTPVTLTASWRGVSISRQLTLTPGVAPDSLTLDPAVTTGTQGSSGRVAVATPRGVDTQFILSTSNPSVGGVPPTVTIPAFAAAASFPISTSPVSTSTTVTISASGAGVTKSAILTVNPTPAGPLPAPSLISPPSGARFAVGAAVNFDWSDVTGAARYGLQVSTSNTFSTTVVNQTALTASQFSTTSLPKADLFWRARAFDSPGNPGAWSAARGFRVK
jgi:hypothetical protein